MIFASTVTVRPSYHVDVMVNRFGKAMVDEKSLQGRGWYDDDLNDHDDYGSTGAYQHPMSTMDFDRLINRIREQHFRDQKKIMARDAITRNYFLTAQVVQLLQQFSFENDKLEMAKLVYFTDLKEIMKNRCNYQQR
ncbi:MAG: DUF4476 domain-containing protein [Flavisolibacter sp.]|nr:DUF4476 domain-containing protein [Flavisolibacter sp.]